MIELILELSEQKFLLVRLNAILQFWYFRVGNLRTQPHNKAMLRTTEFLRSSGHPDTANHEMRYNSVKSYNQKTFPRKRGRSLSPSVVFEYA